MKKLAILAAVASLSAGSAFAGGYADPIVEAEPIVMEEAGTSAGGLLVPALLVLLVVAAVASSDSSGGTDEVEVAN